jgi:hypothetical protein
MRKRRWNAGLNSEGGKRNMREKVGGFILAGVLVLGAVAIAQMANHPPGSGKALIEVHGPDIAFVPLTAKYVTYDGEVRKIVKFTETIEGGKEDCKCPHCCDGNCYVIIYTDLALPGGPVRSLFFLWIECD